MCADNGIVEEASASPGRKSHIRLQNPWENEKALSALWLHRRMLSHSNRRRDRSGRNTGRRLE